MATASAVIDQITQRLLMGKALYRKDFHAVQVGGSGQLLADLQRNLAQFGAFEETRVFTHMTRDELVGDAPALDTARDQLDPAPRVLVCVEVGEPSEVPALLESAVEMLADGGLLVIYDRVGVQSKWIEAPADDVVSYVEYQRMLRGLGMRVRQFTAAAASERSVLVATKERG